MPRKKKEFDLRQNSCMGRGLRRKVMICEWLVWRSNLTSSVQLEGQFAFNSAAVGTNQVVNSKRWGAFFLFPHKIYCTIELKKTL